MNQPMIYPSMKDHPTGIEMPNLGQGDNFVVFGIPAHGDHSKIAGVSIQQLGARPETCVLRDGADPADLKEEDYQMVMRHGPLDVDFTAPDAIAIAETILRKFAPERLVA